MTKHHPPPGTRAPPSKPRPLASSPARGPEDWGGSGSLPSMPWPPRTRAWPRPQELLPASKPVPQGRPSYERQPRAPFAWSTRSLGTCKYPQEACPATPRPGPGALAFLRIRPSAGQEWGGWPRPLTAGNEARRIPPNSSHLSGMQSLPEGEEAGQPTLRPRDDTGNHRPGLLGSPTGGGVLPALDSPHPYSGYPPLTAEESRFQEVKRLLHSTGQGHGGGGTGPQIVAPKAPPGTPCARPVPADPPRPGRSPGWLQLYKGLARTFFIPWSLQSVPPACPLPQFTRQSPKTEKQFPTPFHVSPMQTGPMGRASVSGVCWPP